MKHIDADFAVIGTWRDDMKVNQDEWKAYVGRKGRQHVIDNITHPLFNLSVDASTVSLEGPMRNNYMHPLPFAGMIHYLTYWVRERERWPLEALSQNYRGEVATRYRYADGAGEVGFISSVSEPFCGDCHRARISADGTLYNCLFAHEGTNLRNVLRAGASDADLDSCVANYTFQCISGLSD